LFDFCNLIFREIKIFLRRQHHLDDRIDRDNDFTDGTTGTVYIHNSVFSVYRTPFLCSTLAMRSWFSKQSPLLGSRFATAFLALTSSPLSSSVSSAFATSPRTFGGLPLHSSLHSQSLQSQSLQTQSQCQRISTNWQQLRGGSLSSSLSMSTTAEAPAKTGSNMSAGDKLDALRRRMKELDLDVYLVPSDDPHLSGTMIVVDLM
jgi:hypothetical protein